MLLAINLINYIDRYIVSAVEPLIRAELLPADDPNAKAKMGSLAPAFLITYMLTSPIFGWLGDRYHRWTIVGLGVLLWTFATGASGLATSFTFLLLMRVLVGAGEAAWGPVAPTIIADMYPVSKRGWVMSWFYLAIPVGSALGFILGGAIASWKSWHWAFFFAVPPGVVLGIWAFFRPDPPRGAHDRKCTESEHNITIKHVPFLTSLKGLLRNRSYLLNSAAMTASTFAIGGMSFWMPTYIHEYRLNGGTDATGKEQLAHINFVFGGITVVCGIAATLLGGYISDRLRGQIRGAYSQVAGWSMLVAFPFFLGVLYMPFPYAWYMMGAAIFFMFLNTGPTNTVLANVTPSNVRATAFAVNIFLIHALGDAISPALIGLFSDRTGSMTRAFLLVGGAILIAGVVWLIASRWLDQDTEKYA